MFLRALARVSVCLGFAALLRVIYFEMLGSLQI